ncbi:MAG: cytochrome C oxidase subunit IV family protein [Chloroflexi bacterium]|nr:cytochrome C oxidase subunit IV family protein [Anaerolineaceae bacterium]NMB87069.1 cytochrome C oxidase subunit IV family protein [Chloroflexota bacterium]
MNQNEQNKSGELSQGVVVFAGLAMLTLGEYLIGVYELGAFFLIILALGKAGMVLWFFMHIFRLFSSDEGDHA